MRTRLSVLGSALIVVIGAPLVALAQQGSMRMDIKGRFEPNGDAQITQSLKLPPPLYQKVKQANPNPYKWLRDLSSGRSDYEMVNGTARYDDATSSVVVEMKQLGGVKNTGEGLWEWTSQDPDDSVKAEFLNQSKDASGRTMLYFTIHGESEGVPVSGTGVVTLPAGAKDAKWDEGSSKVTYTLPFQGGGKAGRLTSALKVKDKLMTGCYKAYGLEKAMPGQWVAKTVIRNTGDGPIRDLKVRYKMQGYSEWSPWERYPEVIPGQTVVSVYYPILDKSVAALRTSTPTNLMAEWKYTDSLGLAKEDSDGKKVTLLGVNDFVFGNLTAGEVFEGVYDEMVNNAELLASWVARDDPVVRDFAYLANKRAGGAAAQVNDDQAAQALQAAYELMVANDFTYNSPPGIIEKSVSFDEKMVQNVKHPREVIRQKSGTCIDLAILYASMVHAMGMKAYVVLIPGHAYPAVQLPSGQLVAVETTGISGGSRAGGTGRAASFEQVVKRGIEELKEVLEGNTPAKLIDVQKEWAKGISNPELEQQPADILQRWGIKEGGPALRSPARPTSATSGGTGSGSGAGGSNATFMAIHQHGAIQQMDGDYSCNGTLVVSAQGVQFMTGYSADQFISGCAGLSFSQTGGNKVRIKAGGRNYDFQVADAAALIGTLTAVCGGGR